MFAGKLQKLFGRINVNLFNKTIYNYTTNFNFNFSKQNASELKACQEIFDMIPPQIKNAKESEVKNDTEDKRDEPNALD
jgi:hypothetical protein